MKRKTLTVKMTLDTILSGGRGREVKRKKWSIKKKLPLSGGIPKKMKRHLKKLTKFMGLFVLSLVLLMPVGCGGVGSYTEPEEIAVVSAIGFDAAERGVRVSVQTVNGSGKAPEVIDGEGESIDLALSSVYSDGSRRLEFSHCALVVLGDGLDKETVSEIYGLCGGNDEISDAVLLVGAHEAYPLLSLENAAGYDVATAMRSYPEGAGLFSKNRFYEIIGSEKTARGAGVAALPYFYVSDGKYSLRGLKLYRGRAEKVLLDRRESALYLMMRGIFTSGSVEFFDGNTVKTASLGDCKTDLSRINDGIITCRLTLGEEMSEKEKKAFLTSCREGASEIFETLSERYGDLFGYGEKKLRFDFEIEGRA